MPIEFYNVFWPSIGELLVKCFNEAYERKEMSNSQRKGVITLIEKTGRDRTYLENWRPISLTNVDAKIASKVIATRIVKILPEIIHSNQTGCFWPIHRGGSYINSRRNGVHQNSQYSGHSIIYRFQKSIRQS